MCKRSISLAYFRIIFDGEAKKTHDELLLKTSEKKRFYQSRIVKLKSITQPSFPYKLNFNY